jgi:uncharacterized delta-60 repeat protein
LGAGFFRKVNGTNRQAVARLNADGSLDTSFDPGTGALQVNSLALQPDGKIIIGWFSGYNGGTNRNIARVNADGSLDRSFNVGTGVGDGSDYDYVNCVLVQPDSKVLVGGSFYLVQGKAARYICRLTADGSLDTAFQPPYTYGEPSLAIDQLGSNALLSWPTNAPGFILQSALALDPLNWSDSA